MKSAGYFLQFHFISFLFISLHIKDFDCHYKRQGCGSDSFVEWGSGYGNKVRYGSGFQNMIGF